MRGMVMEVKGKTLVVLTSQGQYIRVKNHGNSVIGDFVPCDAPIPFRIHWVPRKAIALAASFILICSAGLGAYGYSQPFGIVSIDINPSMTLTYNWFEQVIGVEALNSDAEKLLPDLDALRNKPVLEAVETIVSAASQAGYLKPELENVVFISVSDKSSSKRSSALLKALENEMPEISGEAETVLLSGTPRTYDNVKKTHETPTKELIESSLKSQPENDPLTHSSKPLKEIMNDQKVKKEKMSHPKNKDNENNRLVPDNPENNTRNDNQEDNTRDPEKKKDTKRNWNPSEKNSDEEDKESDYTKDKEYKDSEHPRPESDNEDNNSKKNNSERNHNIDRNPFKDN